MGDTYHKKSQEVPVINAVDVIVCEGGTSGIFAALAAARVGAKTFLMEKEGFSGGTATSYLVNPLPGMMGKGGIIQDLMDRMVKLGGYIKKTLSGKRRVRFFCNEYIRHRIVQGCGVGNAL